MVRHQDTAHDLARRDAGLRAVARARFAAGTPRGTAGRRTPTEAV
ncbi:hypothetical protein [Prosthecomicrobium sp. N25]